MINSLGTKETRLHLDFVNYKDVIEPLKSDIIFCKGHENLGDCIKSKINGYFRKIEEQYGILILISVIRAILEEIELIKLDDELRSTIVDSLKNWESYALSYVVVNDLEVSSYLGGFFKILYNSNIRLKMGDFNLSFEGLSMDLEFEHRFYLFWYNSLYIVGEEKNINKYFPIKVHDLEKEKITLIFSSGEGIEVSSKRLVYMRLVLTIQEFLYGAQTLEKADRLRKLIGEDLFNQLINELKGDFYMIWKLYELYLECQNSHCPDFKREIDISKLETQLNLVPFLAIDIVRRSKLGDQEEHIKQLYEKIAVIMISYFGLDGLNSGNWYIRILAKILNRSTEEVTKLIKEYYENFISNVVSSGEMIITPSKRIGWFTHEIVPSNRTHPPSWIVSELEKFLGPLGVVIYYPDQENVVAYGNVSNIKDSLDKKDLKELIKKLTPGERRELRQCGNILLPFGSRVQFTSFGPTDRDNALILVVRGGRGYPPLNKDILDIVLKAVHKDNFNLEALLDFFVLNEAGETRNHLESVARIYAGILEKLKVLATKSLFGKVRDVIFKTTSSLAAAFGLRSFDGGGLEAKYHDIGKIGPTRALIQKEGELSDWGKEIVELHTILGAGFLWRMAKRDKKTASGDMEIAIVLALTHHMLSKKYPFDLGGTEEEFERRKALRVEKIRSLMEKDGLIYFEYALDFLKLLTFGKFHEWFNKYKIQILAMHIADIYDALREDRPYREGIPPKKAIETLKKELAILENPTHPLHKQWGEIKKLLAERPLFLEELRSNKIF